MNKKIYTYGDIVPKTEISEILPILSAKKIAHMKKKLNNPNSFINKLIEYDRRRI